MQGKTRSQKPKLKLGLEKNVLKQRLSRLSEVVEEMDVVSILNLLLVNC